MHGGTHPVGALAPQATAGGVHSRYLPERMRERYAAALADPELLALRGDLALIDARLVDVLSRVESGESSHVWTALRKLTNEIEAAQRASDDVTVKASLPVLIELVQRGFADTAAWQDVRSLVRDRKALVESERRRLVEMRQMVSSEQAMVLVGALVGAVKDNVSDPRALANISAAFVRILGHDGGTGADAAGGGVPAT